MHAAAGGAAAGRAPGEEKPKRGREASTEAAAAGERAARSGRSGGRGGWRNPRQAAAKAAADQDPHQVPASQHWVGAWPTSICSPLRKSSLRVCTMVALGRVGAQRNTLVRESRDRLLITLFHA